jgi:WD40 repeat protein
MPGPPPPERPTVYQLPPVITALAFSPDGKTLAVAGSYEILLHDADGSKLVRRLPSGSPRTATLVYSADGKILYAAGGAPGQFGQVQTWDLSGDGTGQADYRPTKNWRVATDLPFGLCLSPSGDRIAFGCADRTGRVLSLADGKELFHVEQHTDWVLGVAFTVDGKTLLTTGRDKAMKLSDARTGRPIEQINEPQEPITCAARHPTQNLVAVGGAGGSTRLYKISDLQKRTDANRDPNRVKELERLNGPVNAVAFSPDGNLLAVAATGEARVFSVKDGRRVATLSASSPGAGTGAGPVFAVAFSPDAKRVATGGYDGQVRLFDAEKGTLLKSFIPVPLDQKR